MVIISMLLAMGVFLVVIVGIIILLIGLILDIIWIVKSIRKNKAHIVLKIFAVLLTVIGLITAVTPVLLINTASGIKDAHYQKEINDFSEDEIAHVSHMLNLDEGFTFKGKQYVECPEDRFKPPITRDEWKAVGAIVYDNGKHTLLYEFPNSFRDDIICTEGSVFCTADKLDDMIFYYENNASYKCSISFYDEERYRDWSSSELNSENIRNIKEFIDTTGSNDHDALDEEFSGAEEGYYYFYSEDEVYYFTFAIRLKNDKVEASCNKVHAILPDEYAEYIRENLPE